MSTSDWRRVPIGPDAARWTTRGRCKNVLVVVHTITSGQRLLEAVPLIESDLRVQVVYTVARDVFDLGVREFLADLGVVVVPWLQATQLHYDLALAAGYGGLAEIHAPVVVLPHGAGFTKLAVGRRGRRAVGGGTVGDGAAYGDAAYGLDAQRLLHDGVVVPAALVLPHEADLRRLARSCPAALPAAVVVGDPEYDRLAVSLPDRDKYRTALRVGKSRRLVVVTSTWGPNSLFGRRIELLPRLLSELPADRYRVLALVHPNAWSGHGTRQIRAWLGDCLRGGLSLLPPEADWLGALAAADCLIGDHGSVTLYGAAAGIPVLSAGIRAPEVDPESALGELLESVPVVPGEGSLRDVLDRAFTDFSPDLFRRLAGRITSEPGRFNRNMRRVLYKHLGIPQPSTLPVTLPAPPTYLRERWGDD